MTPQELKASVLLYALQGRLVAHDPSEGTGRDEIEKMLRHKELLQKNKEIKKEKPIPPVTDNEITSDIPDNWCWERIGNIGSWSAGATPPRTNPDYYGGDIPWLKTGDLNDGIVSSVPEYITDLALQKTSVRLNPIGSVLMAMYGATIGKLGILDTPMTTNQACCACIPYEGMFNKYLFYFLMGNRLNFIKMGEGGAQPNISKEKIVNFPIAVPPLAEQRRIVTKLEEILPLIDRYEAAWNKLEEFNKRFPGDMQKSSLQLAIQGKLVEHRPEEGTGEELFQQIQAEKQALIKAGTIKKEKPLPEIADDEVPFDIPDTWKWMRVGNLAVVQSSKRVFEKDYVSEGIPFFRSKEIGNLYRNESIKTELFITEEHYAALAEGYGVPQVGDILITSVGTIGNTWICDGRKFYYKDGNITQICGNRFFDSRYVEYFLHSPLFEKQALSTVAGTAYSALTIIKLKNLIIPLPPLVEQKRIVAKLEEILPLCDRLK